MDSRSTHPSHTLSLLRSNPAFSRSTTGHRLSYVDFIRQVHFLSAALVSVTLSSPSPPPSSPLSCFSNSRYFPFSNFSNCVSEIRGNQPKMAKEGCSEIGHVSSRQTDLKRSFKLGLHALLTTCSKEEFYKAFPRFTQAEKERLHRLYIQVIVSLHQNIEDEFEALCEETKVGGILGTVEKLVEEQALDPLYPDKTNLNDVEQVLSTIKKNEIRNLTTMLEKSEARNKVLRSRVELLQKEMQDFSEASHAVEKVRF
ncbi:hypothetical protein SSX86_022545 [Deinandra increscens subsp. villosa]|uniref:Uncharacterized protein n=1 Tax=Deinandra increscens subsp. villosa TaxID=3103831 RepID=A0AAP0CJ32_9ASTR